MRHCKTAGLLIVKY